MGIAQIPPPVKLIIAITFDPSIGTDEVFSALDARFGARDEAFGPIPFSWTEYYAAEMGTSLYKVYVTYLTPVARDRLPLIKNFTNQLEAQYAVAGKRRVNIDPGYIAKDKLVLASTKDFFHRLYLGEGIFGEVTLHYRKGRYRFFSWTYPDYRDTAFLSFLEKARASLVIRPSVEG
jgi:hypothetical protein